MHVILRTLFDVLMPRNNQKIHKVVIKISQRKQTNQQHIKLSEYHIYKAQL